VNYIVESFQCQPKHIKTRAQIRSCARCRHSDRVYLCYFRNLNGGCQFRVLATVVYAQAGVRGRSTLIQVHVESQTIHGKPTSEEGTPRTSGAPRCSAQRVLCVVTTQVAVVDARSTGADNAAPHPGKFRLTCNKPCLGNRRIPWSMMAANH
jgi:hypothetical protein